MIKANRIKTSENSISCIHSKGKLGTNHQLQSTEDKLINLYRHLVVPPASKTRPSVDSAMFSDNRVAFSVSEAAFLVGLSTRTIERLISKNEIKVRRIGRRILIPKQEFEAWLNQME